MSKVLHSWWSSISNERLAMLRLWDVSSVDSGKPIIKCRALPLGAEGESGEMKLSDERRKQIEEETGEPALCSCCGYAAEELGESRGPVTKDFLGGKGMSVFCLI